MTSLGETTMIQHSDGVIQADINGFKVDGWKLALEMDGLSVPLSQARMTCDSSSPRVVNWVYPNPQITWSIDVEERPDEVVIRSTIHNAGPRAVRLGKAVLFHSKSVSLGDDDDEIVALMWPSDHARQNVYRLDDQQLPASTKIKAQFYNASRRLAVQVGFLTFQRADTEVSVKANSSGTAVEVSAWCDFAGWMLEAGASTSTETFRLAADDNPYRQMEQWALQAGELVGVKKMKDPPIGYLGWSWTDCIHGSQTYQQATLEVLDAINEKLAGFGVRYLWTSMTNLEGSLPGNWLKWNDRSIPMGRRAFIEAVRNRGFVPGFWVGPFYLCSTLRDAMDELGEAILNNPDGSPMVVCPSWSHGDAGLLKLKDRPCLYALDPSHPKALAYIRRVFETYRQWGIRYYMIDFLEAGAGSLGSFPYQSHHDQSLVAGPETYLKFIRTIKEAAGEDAFLLSSTGPKMHNAGVVDGARIGSDFGEGRALSPESFFYPATFVINQMDFWTAARDALTSRAIHYHEHRKLYLADAGNVLTVDQPVPVNHARIAATIHGLFGGGSMLGDDLRTIHPERLSMIKKTLPRPRETARPVDLFEMPSTNMLSMFQRQVDKPWQKFDVIAIFNLQDRPIERELDPAKTGLDPNQDYLAWDFWNESFAGRLKGGSKFHVDAESVRVLRLTVNRDRPTLMGSDMHLMMGEMEIEEASYDPSTMIFRLRSVRPPGEKGTAYIYAPDNVYVKNFEGLRLAKDGRDNSLIIAVPLDFNDHGRATKEIHFGILQEVLDMHKLNLA
jgi:hypothetical protein